MKRKQTPRVVIVTCRSERSRNKSRHFVQGASLVLVNSAGADSIGVGIRVGVIGVSRMRKNDASAHEVIGLSNKNKSNRGKSRVKM